MIKDHIPTLVFIVEETFRQTLKTPIAMDYQTFRACRDLNEFVKCYWTLNMLKEPSPQNSELYLMDVFK
jgi:hypothetical protein